MPPDPDHDVEALAEKIRRGEELTAEETLAIFKTADEAGLLYYELLTMVREQRALSELPIVLKKIITTGAWRRWRWVGSTFSQNSLRSYLTSPPPNGVGMPLDMVEKLIADDAEARAAYREAMVGEPGAHVPHDDNIMMRNSEQGTSLSYTVERLKRDHPELFERVVRKELSANAAAIEAGFRHKPTPFEIAKRVWPKLTAEEREQIKAMPTDHEP
jgi:hypothetical protein